MDEPNEDHKGYDLVVHITVDWQQHRDPKHNRAGGVCIAQTRESTSTGKVLESQQAIWYEFNHGLYWIRTFQLAHMTAILYAFRHARKWNPSTWRVEAVMDGRYRLQAIRFKIWHLRARHEETLPLMSYFLDNPDQLLRARSPAQNTFEPRQQFNTQLSDDYGIRTTMRKVLGAMDEMARCHNDVPVYFEEGSDHDRVHNLMAPKWARGRKARKRQVSLKAPYRPRTPPLCKGRAYCKACVRNGTQSPQIKKKKKKVKLKREGVVKQEDLKQEQEPDVLRSEDVKQKDVKQEDIKHKDIKQSDIKRETKGKLEAVEQVEKAKLESEEQPAFDLYAYAAYTEL